MYQRLNEWGEHGWKLVTVTPTVSQQYRLIFKRQKT